MSRERGALIEIAIPTGRLLREFEADLGEAGLGEGVGALVHSPARGSVLFSRVITAANQQIVEVPLDGDRAEVVATGHAVAVAPDGDRLAVGRRELGDEQPDREVLEIRTFDGRVLRRWADPVRSEEPLRISDLTWSPDGSRLAFQLRFEDGTEVRMLDPSGEGGSLQEDSRKVQPPGDLRMLATPQFRPGTGALVVVDGPGLDPEAEQLWRIVSIAPRTGEVGDVLAESDRAVTRLDFDPTGRQLLYVLGHGHPPRTGHAADAPVLIHWRDRASTTVAGGFVAATW